ncbi:cytosolic sulfotransferase 5-like [Pyrus x bretschneideri]|uniref:cytosolic sulfotransferase 5-like n=1 Tax=Pyrus x bretschneideri TaxID=225117 RepID=UPI00202EF4A7|nr:cytosolic sulfotransferase 5-like [Pyrus x bretschneideri]
MASVSLGVDQEIISTLPKDTGWAAEHYYQYQNFWYPQVFLEGVIWAQQDFRARDSDIFLATFPKCGTTWVKALMIAIKNRKDCDYSSHPLLTKNPHDIVPYIELLVHQDNPVEYLDSMASPRLLASHIPHSSLPNSLLDSDTRVVYIARNPKDVLVSFWAFSEKLRSKGYWEASLKNPNKVLFFKFEDLKADTEGCVKRLAEFIGYPFSSEEEKEGAVQEIIKFCSFENLSSLEVNKSGTYHVGPKTDEKFSNDVFFRRGETGDSQKHLTPEMLERLDKITEQKFGASGLKF